MSLKPPNVTMVPNAVFDELLPTLGAAELKVLLYLSRQTFGWQREWTKEGYGRVSAIVKGTGLSRQGAVNGLVSLRDRGIVECRTAGRSFEYRVSVNEMDRHESTSLTDGGGAIGQRNGPPSVNEVDRSSVNVVDRIKTNRTKQTQTNPPTPTPIIPEPPTADHAPATAAATGGGHKAPTKPRTKPVTVQAPPALFVLPAAEPSEPPPPRVDPWEALYTAAALDLEGKATAWRHHRTGRALASYGELAAAIGPSVADDPEAAVEVWRAIVTAKKAERLGDGRPVWTVFAPSNAARLCRRHLQDNPGFAAGASSLPPAGIDPAHVRRRDDGRWILRPFNELRAGGHIPPDASPSDTSTWGDAVRLTHAALRAYNAA